MIVPTLIFAGGPWSTSAGTGVAPFGPGVDLLDAVRQWFAAQAVAASVTGIYLRHASRRAAMPYVVVDDVGAHSTLNTSTSKVRMVRLRFRVYSEDLDTAGTVGDALEDALRGQRLAFSDGFTGPFVPGDRRHEIDPALSAGGSEVWYLLVEFSVQVRENA